MLLSDGTVMIQGGGAQTTSANWYKLTPDATGSYINGTFSPRASMSLPRLFFGTNVLPSGKVFLLGGEYSGPDASQPRISSKGEIYDPVTDSWSPIPDHPESFGDDPSIVLANGKVLAGSLSTPHTFLYDPATNTWSQAGTKLRSERSDEETWTLLPDGSVLSYDNFSSSKTRVSTAQRYIPSTNTWVDTGPVPVLLSTIASGFEIGPALLLPDGRVFQIGADGNTALYDSTTNTWAAGPTVPGMQGADDAPGVILPNGHVMFAVDTPLFNTPTTFYDYDPDTNSLTNVTPTGTLGTLLANSVAQEFKFVALPNGDVLMSGDSNFLWEFTPDGVPNDAWRPTITSITPNGGATFTIAGTQLNGLSAGSSFGDDSEMDSNFPIVQLTNDATGQVFYARTFNWTPSVATGNAQVTAQFTLPAGLPQTAYSLRVVTNGIASAPAILVNAPVLHVNSSTPAPTSVVSVPPTSFVFNFNEAVVPATLQASDLTVNGHAANAVALDATGQIATFTFTTSPVTAQGVQNMAIAANAITGADGTGIFPFSASFRYDALTLAVTATTPSAGGVFTIPGTSTFDVTFNEPIDPATAGVDNLTLNQGTVTSSVVLPGSTEVRYTIAGLTTEGPMTIRIPAGRLKDQFDNPGFTSFRADYQVDVGTEPITTPLTPESPRGSLIYDTALTGLINFAGDTDTFTVNLDAGQTVTLLVTPTAAGLRPTVQLVGPDEDVLASARASAAGQPALLQTVPAQDAGTYAIVVGSANRTVGSYSVKVTLNAAIETEGVTTGSNATPATAQDINGSFVSLRTPLTRAQRGAVLGTTENSVNYAPSSVAPSFVDISSTGNRSTNAVGNDGTDTLDATQLGGFTFRFFGTTYDSLSFSTNGLISFGVADSNDFNTDLSTSPAEPVVAPFWNFMTNPDFGVGPGSRAIYWQTIGSGANQQLIIQWNNVNQVAIDPNVTFEAVLSTDGTIQFNYGAFMDPGDFDFATVGVKAAGTDNPIRTLLDFNGTQAPGNLLGPGQSVKFTPPNPTYDVYSFTASAGQTSSLALTGLTPGNLRLDLLAPDGSTVLASGVSGGPNQALAIRNFTFTTSGTFFARVSGDDVTQYSLVALRDAAIDTGIHVSFATAENIGTSHTVLGGFASNSGTQTVTLNAVDSGSWDSQGNHFAGFENYEVGQSFPGEVLNDYFVFDLSGISQEIASAQLTLSNPFGGYVSPDPSETINFSDVSTPINVLEGSGPDLSGIFTDLGTGTSFGTQTVTPGTDPVTTTLNADAINALTAGLGGQFAMGGSLTSISGSATQLLFTFSGNPSDQRQLSLTLAQTADWYKFTLPSDRTAVQLDTSTFADGPGEFVNTLDPHIELYDANDHLIASGTALADGRNETIRATGLTAGGTYYVRVTADNNTTGEYILGVTPLRTPTVTSTVDDAPKGAEEQPDGEFHVPNSPDKGWTHIVSAAGFQGDYTIHAQNASPQKSNFAEWEIRATSANPELFATWVALPGNATNATYQVFADSGDGGNDDTPLLSVVVDQTRGPSDALLFGTTLAQSLGSVNLPHWTPGTMLTVRLLTQGANGDVVADGMFDPPTWTVIRPDSVPPGRPQLEARDTPAIPRLQRADPVLMIRDDTGTMRREAAVDAVFIQALTDFEKTPATDLFQADFRILSEPANGGGEAAVPLAFGGSLSAQSELELSSPRKLWSIGPVVDLAHVRVPQPSLDWIEPATTDDFWAGVFVGEIVNS
jgi:hypothetical protein